MGYANDYSTFMSAKSKPTVLVVDDFPEVLDLCAAFLQSDGFEVLKAPDSSRALQICTKHAGNIDVLLTDLVLMPRNYRVCQSEQPYPQVHGHELALRAAIIRPGLRIVLMSGNPDIELEQQGIKRCDLPFLDKPFTKNQLVTMLQRVVKQPAPVLDFFCPEAVKDSQIAFRVCYP